ncbi:uncharacterized protein [Penaeus vannamei]|uniref:uncharacterized protein n=1 Tax=Penaeus vannamei TaxID=6689 RepID=UPI00387F79DC
MTRVWSCFDLLQWVIPASELPSTMELYPSLAIIMGVVGGILIVFVVIVVVMVVRRPRRENLQGRLHQDDSSLHILKKDDSHSGRLDVDEKDPDVIPETRGSRGDLAERRGVADVSTLYGEMVGVAGGPSESVSHAHPHAHPVTDPPPPPAHANAYTEPNPLAAHGTHATHAHVEPVHAHAESQQHTHHTQYIQQEYTPPAPPPALVEMHHSASYHHMPPSATTAAPTYTHAHAVPVSHTQTLPHPRSGHARAQHAHAATLQRRSSLYMSELFIQTYLLSVESRGVFDRVEMGAEETIQTEHMLSFDRIHTRLKSKLKGYFYTPKLYHLFLFLLRKFP